LLCNIVFLSFTLVTHARALLISSIHAQVAASHPAGKARLFLSMLVDVPFTLIVTLLTTGAEVVGDVVVAVHALF
jgi:hypothetical protein